MYYTWSALTCASAINPVLLLFQSFQKWHYFSEEKRNWVGKGHI